ncbi:histidine phosphatase family protein [Shewanella maritima]|uniref:histidine phosphatase family protein n=1 Tax=Shewanella maritima TaxID=2520507 RepID=UPI0037356D0F
MSKVLLIRHGQASFGAQNYDQLSPLGMQQAQLLGQHLCQRDIQDCKVIRGNMQRHLQTLTHCMEQLTYDATEPTVLPQLNEFDHQDVLLTYGRHQAGDNSIAEFNNLNTKEKLNTSLFIKVFYQAISRWQSSLYDEQYSESWSQFCQRINTGLNQLIQHSQESQQPLLVFTSGGVISRIVCQLLGLADDQLMTFNKHLINCSVTELKVGNKRTEIISLNEQSLFDGPNKPLRTLL